MKTISTHDLAINEDVVSKEERQVFIAFANAFENMPDNMLVEFINTLKLMMQIPDLYVGCVFVEGRYEQQVMGMPFEEFSMMATYEACLRGLSEKV